MLVFDLKQKKKLEDGRYQGSEFVFCLVLFVCLFCSKVVFALFCFPLINTWLNLSVFTKRAARALIGESMKSYYF